MPSLDVDAALLERQLLHLMEALTSAADRVVEAPPITSTQRHLLNELVDAGPLRLGALAARIGAAPPTVSRAMDGLVAAKFVKRQPDPDDRRAVLHVAMRRGKAWVHRRRAVVVEALESALVELSGDERRILLELTAKLNEELQWSSSRALTRT
jgi:DNA-binding MarR family transcriptional regulator